MKKISTRKNIFSLINLIALFLICSCGEKSEKLSMDLYVDYAANFGNSSSDFLSKMNSNIIIPNKLKLLDIEKIKINDKNVQISTYNDFSYNCTRENTIDCEEFEKVFDENGKSIQKSSGNKYLLSLDTSESSYKLGLNNLNKKTWYKLTTVVNKYEYVVNDVKITKLPFVDEFSDQLVGFEINGKEFVLTCISSQCDELAKYSSENSDDNETKDTSILKKFQTVSGKINISVGEVEGGGGTYTRIELINAKFK